MNLVQHFINHPDLLEDEIKLKRILTDCFSGDKSKVNRMMAAHELGIVKMLMNNTFSEFDRKKLINQLVDVYNMQMEKADDAIEEWKKLFSNDLIYAYSKYYSGKSSFDMKNYKKNTNKNTVVITGNERTSKIDLINALLGREFINRYTKLDSLPAIIYKKSENNCINIIFYTDNEWDDICKYSSNANLKSFNSEYQKINAESCKEQWINQKSKTIPFDSTDSLAMVLKNEILSDLQMMFFTKAIIICVTEWNLNDNYKLVYTPESTDKFKTELTNEFIDIADLIILSIDAGGSMTAKTMGLINAVFKKANCSRENIFIAVNQLDNLNRSLKNWKTGFLESLKYLSGKFAYSNSELAEKNVCPVFSYLFSLLIDYNNMKENDSRLHELKAIITKFGLKDISGRYYDLLEYTNIEKLKSIIQNS